MARFFIPSSGQSASADTSAIEEQLTVHISDTDNVHGIPDTSVLETQSGAQTKANTAQTNAATYTDSVTLAHSQNTLSVHGIDDTSLLVNQSQLASASASTLAGANLYSDGLASNYDPIGSASAVASDLADHKIITTNVHGIADTANLVTNAELTSASSSILTQAQTDAVNLDVAAIQQANTYTDTTVGSEIATHNFVTQNVHGIINTADLVVTSDLANYATTTQLSTHESDTTGVHGIANTANLLQTNTSITVTGLNNTGNTTLGNASTDTLNITAGLSSNIIPNTNSTRELGSSANRFGKAYVDDVYLNQKALTFYEEGTWLPAYPSLSVTGVNARFTRIGRSVTVQAAFTVPTNSLNEILSDSSLPYAPTSTGNYEGSWRTSGTAGVCSIRAGAILLFNSSASSQTSLVLSGKFVIMTCTYFTDDYV